jgi:hypothetical protein
MGAWYKFWSSRVGSGLFGAFGLYCVWVLLADPSACSLPTRFPHYAVCAISSVFGNLATSVVVALVSVFFFYIAFRPQRL